MRAVWAILFGLVLGGIGLGMLRALAARTPRNVPKAEAELVPLGVRVTYWCQECGTELMLLRKGSESPPRHCGEAMTRREEIQGRG